MRLEGTVVHSDAAWRLLFVADSSGTTFVDPIGLPKLPSPGARVLVEGETGLAGGFAGVVSARVVETGRGQLPTAGSSLRSLDMAAERLAWAEVRGVVRTLEASRGHSIVGIQMGGGRLEVLVAEELRSAPPDLVDSEVLVLGVLELGEGGGHPARQWVTSWSHLRVAEKATPPGSLVPVSVEEALSLARSPHPHRVRLRGRLAERESTDTLVLQDDSGTIEARGFDQTGITLGAALDVVGFLDLGMNGSRGWPMARRSTSPYRTRWAARRTPLRPPPASRRSPASPAYEHCRWTRPAVVGSSTSRRS